MVLIRTRKIIVPETANELFLRGTGANDLLKHKRNGNILKDLNM
jgi:hypothetical protein